MIEKIIRTLSDPNNENFWPAISTIVTIFVALAGGFGWVISRILNNTISETTHRIIKGQTEIFINWVKVRSKSEKIDDNNVMLWLTEQGGTVNLGREYIIYKKFIKELRKENYNLRVVDKEIFEKWIKEFDSEQKWSRMEW